MGAGTQTQPSKGQVTSYPLHPVPVPDIPKSCEFNLTAAKISSHFANLRSFWNLPFSGRARGGLWAGAEAWPAGTVPGPVFLGSGSTTHPSPVGAWPVQALGEKRGGPLQPWANKLGAVDRSVKPGPLWEAGHGQGTDLGDPGSLPHHGTPALLQKQSLFPRRSGGWGKGLDKDHSTPRGPSEKSSLCQLGPTTTPCPRPFTAQGSPRSLLCTQISTQAPKMSGGLS